MERILIFGCNGFFGTHFVRAIDGAIGEACDIADERAVAAALERIDPGVVINCAGKAGRPNIDWCESHRGETLRSNVTGPLILANACLAQGRYLVHLSSGCLYQGGYDRGFSEDDEPNFAHGFYSRTKWWSERMLAEFPFLLLRPRMPFDCTWHPRNLIRKIASYETVVDAENSLTFVPDFIDAARRLIDQRAEGVFNIVNPGLMSPRRITDRYIEIVDSQHRCSTINAADLNAKLRAPRSNCRLSIDKLLARGIEMRPVSEAVELALQSIAASRRRPSPLG